jgi:hypothetical protein
VPQAELEDAIADSETWLQRVLRPRWLPPSLSWEGVRETSFGDEVLFAGWEVDDRWLQVASRRSSLHLRTRMQDDAKDALESERFERLVALARVLLNDDVDTSPEGYRIRSMDGFLTVDSKRPATHGWKAFAAATDGVGAKLSLLKQIDRSGFKLARDAPQPTGPWFIDKKKRRR